MQRFKVAAILAIPAVFMAATAQSADGTELAQLHVVQGISLSTYDADGPSTVSRCTSDAANSITFSGRRTADLTIRQPNPRPGLADWGRGTVSVSGSASAGALSNQLHFGPGQLLDGSVPGVMSTPIPFAYLTDADLHMTVQSDAGRADVVLHLSPRGGFMQCAEWDGADASSAGLGNPSTGWRASVQGYLTFEALIYPSDPRFGQPIREAGSGSFSALGGQSQGIVDGVSTAIGSSNMSVILDTQNAQTAPFDVAPPTVTGTPDRAPNTAGWFNAPVTIAWDAVDPAPSAGQPDPASLTTTADREGRQLTYTSPRFCDGAENCAVGTTALSIDLTSPDLTLAGVGDGMAVVVGSPLPSPSCSATDALSGVAGTCQVQVTPAVGADHVGLRTVTATARDLAGNQSQKQSTFSVVYGWDGFAQPVNDTAHELNQSLSVFKAGATIPLRFRLRDATGAVAVPSSAPHWVAPIRIGAASATVNETLPELAETVGLVYEPRGDYWQYNWATSPQQAGSTWRVGVLLDDGREHTVDIALR